MNIGVAKPTPEELAVVPHYFIDTHSIHQEVNAAAFEQYALDAAAAVFSQRDVLIMAGGTGLYIKAFCEGLDIIPPVDPRLRQQITEEYQRKGILWLQEEIRTKDPLYFEKGEIQNPQRLMRALEVRLSSGRSIIGFQQRRPIERDFEVLKYGIALPRPELHENINTRVDRMIAQGLVEEVRSLQAFRSLNALQTVGYTEIFEYLDGRTDLAAAIEKIKVNTRQYARRQLTWFRRVAGLQWIAPDTPLSFFESQLASRS